MAKSPSRPQRWADACEQARTAISDAQAAISEAIENLKDLQSEYQDWLDNLPEVSQGSATEEKLNAVTDLDLEFEPDFSDLESLLDEAEGVDLPRGFGRD